LPRHSGSIFAHWASVSTKRSIQALNHMQMLEKSIIPNRPQKNFEERCLLKKGSTQKLLTFHEIFFQNHP
ncbi:hypothetical protein, partial [Gluconacetobacter entanii]|uniref:hypothetical protein n=1 Tax=Gluconacetobacter entanii TaxID=108528 RepID=UPI0022366A10